MRAFLFTLYYKPYRNNLYKEMKTIFFTALVLMLAYSGISFAQEIPTVACTYVESDARYGMKDKTTNGTVVNIQAFLHGKGFLSVEPTGFFGPLTKKAVQEFQKRYGLPATGFFGPMSRAKMKELTCGDTKDQDLVISLVTDKEAYAIGEKIDGTITVFNASTKTKTLNWNTGCQTHYMIDGEYNSIAGMLCIQALTSKTLAPQESFSWKIEHDPSQYELKAGIHTITGFVQGYGSASKTITVK